MTVQEHVPKQEVAQFFFSVNQYSKHLVFQNFQLIQCFRFYALTPWLRKLRWNFNFWNLNNDLIYFIFLKLSNLLAYKDCLLYLRALFHLSTGKIKEAFKDFYSIDSNEVFPKTFITEELWVSLSFAQKESIKADDFYRNSLEYKKISDESNKFAHLTHQTSLECIEEEYEILDNLCKYFELLIY